MPNLTYLAAKIESLSLPEGVPEQSLTVLSVAETESRRNPGKNLKYLEALTLLELRIEKTHVVLLGTHRIKLIPNQFVIPMEVTVST